MQDHNALTNDAAVLLLKVRAVTAKAYAPYSNFFVGAAALLTNKEIITATNQENASFPVGYLCRKSFAFNYCFNMMEFRLKQSLSAMIKKRLQRSPVFPCCICRQSLTEFEIRMKHPIRLILSGLSGKILIIKKASDLLPLNFNSSDLL
jgi:cytidine deaminase